MNKIGFIGQGWVGKNLADNFEGRKLNIVRYGLEEEYACNKEAIKECEIVFIAVPTPTTTDGFDDSILDSVINLTSNKTLIVIKSTILPTTLKKLAEKYFISGRHFIHSPEFLTEATAKYDTDNPERNILGISDMGDIDRRTEAEEVMSILPTAPYELICSYEEASLIKYTGNCFFYMKNMFFNMVADLSEAYGADYAKIRKAVVRDARISGSHTKVLHKGGRGAGGHCLIKDFAALRKMYKEMVGDYEGVLALSSNELKNKKLLTDSGKDLDLLEGVYGKLGT